MARIFLTGSKGQVGSELEYELLKHNHTVIASNHQTLDISDIDRVMSAVIDSKADAVINAAAYTNVEKSEVEVALAYGVNALGARNLAKACLKADIPLIHISSDYVFSDTLNREHSEDDATKAECAYGKSKLEGENYILSSGCKHLIVRTSWVFGRFGRNFVKIMLSMAQDRRELAVVCDQLGNPTPASALAKDLVTMTEKALSLDFKDFGIYHYCGTQATSWDEFARVIFGIALHMHVLPHAVNVISIKSDEFSSRAKRPQDSRLSCRKIEEVFKIKQPYWPDYISEVVQAFVRESQGLQPFERYQSANLKD